MKVKLNIAIIAITLGFMACQGSITVDSDTASTIDTTTTEEATTDNVQDETEVSASTTLSGIDISSNQGDEAETLDKNADVLSFVICRATDGITWQDPDFATNWNLISEKGFIAGAYHFYESNDDPESQANNYLNTVGTFDANDLPPIVDFEGAGINTALSVEAVQENLLQVLQYLEEKTNRTPILYTNISEGNKYLSNDEFAKYTLWIADYSGNTQPTLPGAWQDSKWVFWQQTDDYILDDQKNDFDLFNGDKAALTQYIKNN